MKTTIQVTADDILAGQVNRACSRGPASYFCPVALACKRTLKTKHICVGRDFVSVEEENVELPGPVREWIFQYDQWSLNVQPFEFEIEI